MAIEVASAVTVFPWAALITALSGLTGALGGAFLANFFAERRWQKQNEYDKEKERINFLRDKGEELHVLFSRWAKSTLIYQLNQLSVAKGSLSEREFHDLAKDIALEPGIHDRVETLLFLYFPELQPDMAELRGKIRDGNSTFDRFVKGGLTQKCAFDGIDKASNETEAVLERIKLGIRERLRSLN